MVDMINVQLLRHLSSLFYVQGDRNYNCYFLTGGSSAVNSSLRMSVQKADLKTSQLMSCEVKCVEEIKIE